MERWVAALKNREWITGCDDLEVQGEKCGAGPTPWFLFTQLDGSSAIL